MQKKTPHKISFDILNQVIFHNAYLSDQFNLYKDITPFSKALCFNSCRYFYILKDILNKYIKKPLKTDNNSSKNIKNQAIETALIMGLCQLIFMDIKPYAAVNETLNCLNTKKNQWGRGLVNGVLRSYLKNNKNKTNNNNKQIIADWINDLHTQNKSGSNYWIINKIINNYKNNAAEIITSMLEHPPMSIRINTSIISNENYLAKLNKHDIKSEKTNLENAIIINPACNISELPGFNNGEVSVQDLAAQYCIKLLNPEPNDIILDACSAPGGKLSHIIDIQPEIKKIIAIEKNTTRFEKLKNTLTRLKLDNNPKIQIFNKDVINTDSWWDKTLFDKIIIDAPCSATGIIRRQPDVQIHRNQQDLDLLINTQSEILEHTWPLLKPGGVLLYITCSLLPEENDTQISKFILNNNNILIQDISDDIIKLTNGQKTKYGLQTLPTNYHTDGFYYSLLKKPPVQVK